MAKKKYSHAGQPPILTSNLPENWKEIIIELMSQGASAVEVRAALSTPNGKFNHALWYALQDREQEFLETIKIGKQLCLAWWEKEGRENLHARFFQTALYFINMKNRFGWRDQPAEETPDELINQKLDFTIDQKELPSRIEKFIQN